MTHLTLTPRDIRDLAGDARSMQPNPVLARIGHLARALVSAHGERTLRRELEARPDRLLADIGISREEIPAFARRAVRVR